MQHSIIHLERVYHWVATVLIFTHYTFGVVYALDQGDQGSAIHAVGRRPKGRMLSTTGKQIKLNSIDFLIRDIAAPQPCPHRWEPHVVLAQLLAPNFNELRLLKD